MLGSIIPCFPSVSSKPTEFSIGSIWRKDLLIYLPIIIVMKDSKLNFNSIIFEGSSFCKNNIDIFDILARNTNLHKKS